MFSKDEVINFLKKNKKTTFLDLVKFLNILPKNNKDFSSFLNKLKDNGEIAYSKKYNWFFLPQFLGNFDVEFKINSNGHGFCFVNLSNGNDVKVMIYKNNLNALKNDLINVDVYQDYDKDWYFGIIKKVKERKNEFIYAEIDKNLDIKPISFSQPVSFIIDKSTLKPNSYAKLKVEKIDRNNLYLSLEKQLMNVEKPYSDIETVIDWSNVRDKFSKEIMEETDNVPDHVENTSEFGRVDLTNKLIVTIDGESTKDFDDAISVEKTNKNTYILGVHIADVAFYVKEGSKIDKEAIERGTSIYLIDKVIPMLPEKLSNGICSLNPNVKRFTLSLESEIDKQGNVLSSKIFPSMIESKYRLTYNQVANKSEDKIINEDPLLKQMIDFAYDLSSIISKNKRNDGYIDFEIEEPIIKLDKESGKTIAIENKARLSSEILIENFMVFANESVSKMVSDLNIPSIYRVHESPDIEKMESLKSFLTSIGINKIKIEQSKDPRIFQKSVEELKKIRFDNLVKMALLRTMQKAKYSSNNIGHFGLASKYYSHFTSPIRRYPDLLLHRIIWEVIIKNNKNYLKDLKNKIDEISTSSSNAEIRAVEIERKVKSIKIAEFYKDQINKIKEAIIVSIHKFGIFIEFEDLTNSFIHISTITDNFSEIKLNDGNKLIVKNDEYIVGQKIRAKIISVNKMEGKIDSIIVKDGF